MHERLGRPRSRNANYLELPRISGKKAPIIQNPPFPSGLAPEAQLFHLDADNAGITRLAPASDELVGHNWTVECRTEVSHGAVPLQSIAGHDPSAKLAPARVG